MPNDYMVKYKRCVMQRNEESPKRKSSVFTKLQGIVSELNKNTSMSTQTAEHKPPVEGILKQLQTSSQRQAAAKNKEVTLIEGILKPTQTTSQRQAAANGKEVGLNSVEYHTYIKNGGADVQSIGTEKLLDGHNKRKPT